MNVDAMIADLVKMTPQQRQQFAQQHMDDPISLSAAKYVDNQIKDQAQKMMQPQGPMPPVNQAIAQSIGQGAPNQPMMTASPQPQTSPPMASQMQSQMQPQQTAVAQNRGLPENSGIATLPSNANFADGGIVGYDKGGSIQNAGSDPFSSALVAEGIQDPTQLAYLRSIYGQESGAGSNTTTSNRGAVGGMQIIPSTFKSVADPGMDINNPVDNARAGIRYAMQGYKAASGDPVLAGAYYYGGPGGMKKAAQNIAVADPLNPKAPTTIGYGKAIARRMTQLLPIGSAQAEEVPSPGIAGLATNQVATNQVAANQVADMDVSPMESEALSPGQIEARLTKRSLQEQVDEQRRAIANQGSPRDDTKFRGDPRFPSEAQIAAGVRPMEAMDPTSPYYAEYQKFLKDQGLVSTPKTAPAGYTRQAMQNDPRRVDTQYSPEPITSGTERGAYLDASAPIADQAPAATPQLSKKAEQNPSSMTQDDWLALAAGLLSNKSQYASEAAGAGLASLVSGRANRAKLAMEQQKNEAESYRLMQEGKLQGVQADWMPATKAAEINKAMAEGNYYAANSLYKQAEAQYMPAYYKAHANLMDVQAAELPMKIANQTVVANAKASQIQNQALRGAAQTKLGQIDKLNKANVLPGTPEYLTNMQQIARLQSEIDSLHAQDQGASVRKPDFVYKDGELAPTAGR